MFLVTYNKCIACSTTYDCHFSNKPRPFSQQKNQNTHCSWKREAVPLLSYWTSWILDCRNILGFCQHFIVLWKFHTIGRFSPSIGRRVVPRLLRVVVRLDLPLLIVSCMPVRLIYTINHIFCNRTLPHFSQLLAHILSLDSACKLCYHFRPLCTRWRQNNGQFPRQFQHPLWQLLHSLDWYRDFCLFIRPTELNSETLIVRRFQFVRYTILSVVTLFRSPHCWKNFWGHWARWVISLQMSSPVLLAQQGSHLFWLWFDRMCRPILPTKCAPFGQLASFIFFPFFLRFSSLSLLSCQLLLLFQ